MANAGIQITQRSIMRVYPRIVDTLHLHRCTVGDMGPQIVKNTKFGNLNARRGVSLARFFPRFKILDV